MPRGDVAPDSDERGELPLDDEPCLLCDVAPLCDVRASLLSPPPAPCTCVPGAQVNRVRF
jgi:hypothetical protein